MQEDFDKIKGPNMHAKYPMDINGFLDLNLGFSHLALAVFLFLSAMQWYFTRSCSTLSKTVFPIWKA